MSQLAAFACTFLLLMTLPCCSLTAQQNLAPAVSPPDRRIDAAQRIVKSKPDSFQSYNDLAYALCRKARDTGDISLYDQADTALKRSLQLSPDNYDARKLKVTVLLGRKDFVAALQLASELNSKVPDDIAGWGFLVDANMALGNYDEAERDAQWILDLRAGSTLGFEKAAALREMFGDIEGAMEFLDEANRRTSLNDADQHAWLLTEKARLELEAGNEKQAEELLAETQKLFPESQFAMAALAKLRMEQERYAEAVLLLGKRYQQVRSSENLYAWAEALDKAGQKAEAAAAFGQFKTKARSEMTKPQNDNLDLVSFYIDHKDDPAEALRIAALLTAERHDSRTLEAYAWALFRNGSYAEAKTQMDRALAVGIRDGRYVCHAAQIAAKANDNVSAAKFRKELTSFGPNACPSIKESAEEAVR